MTKNGKHITSTGASTSYKTGLWGSPVTATTFTKWWKDSSATDVTPNFVGSSVSTDWDVKRLNNKTAGEHITGINITPSIERTAGVNLSTGIDTTAGMKISTKISTTAGMKLSTGKHSTAGTKMSTGVHSTAGMKMSTGTYTTAGIKSTDGMTSSIEPSSCEKLCSRILHIQLIVIVTFLKV